MSRTRDVDETRVWQAPDPAPARSARRRTRGGGGGGSRGGRGAGSPGWQVGWRIGLWVIALGLGWYLGVHYFG